jgi:transcriptional regulator with XRE-family HTH domain
MKSNSYYSADDVIKLLKVRQGTRTQEDFAAEIGISYQLLSNVILGSRSPGNKILKFLKLRKEVGYRKA